MMVIFFSSRLIMHESKALNRVSHNNRLSSVMHDTGCLIILDKSEYWTLPCRLAKTMLVALLTVFNNTQKLV